jgi:predicted ATPase
MFSHIIVENFKSIAKLEMQLSKLNVLIGPNNSGKTSVLQAPAIAKQASQYGAIFQGPIVKVGSFTDAVYKHNKNLCIAFTFVLSPQRRHGIAPHQRARSEYLWPNLRSLTCHVEISSSPDGAPVVLSSLIAHQETGFSLEYPAENVIWQGQRANANTTLRGLVPYVSSGVSEMMEAYNAVSEVVTDEFRDIFYISSMRGTDERSTPVDNRFSERPQDVGIHGEKTLQVLAFLRDDPEYAEVMDHVASWLDRFGLKELAARIARGPSYSLNAKNKITDVSSNILDVGFGINQLLPIIVQCFYAPKGSLIMIEQPEAHLHPKAQAIVADLLADVVKFGNQVIVETHSEHLLLRLQTNIAQKRLRTSDVTINYFDQSAEGTKKTNIKIDDNGYFVQPLPEGFFEEGFQETLAHLKALSGRDKNESG